MIANGLSLDPRPSLYPVVFRPTLLETLRMCVEFPLSLSCFSLGAHRNMIETAACTNQPLERTKTRNFIVLNTYYAASSKHLHEFVNVEMDKRTQFALQDVFMWGKSACNAQSCMCRFGAHQLIEIRSLPRF